MCATASVERRQTRRYPVASNLRFVHQPSERRLPARSIDISDGGMLMYVPATTPVKEGHMLMVTFSDVTRPEVFDLGHRTISAHVIRVDRKALLTTGHLAVGIRFNRVPAEAQSASA